MQPRIYKDPWENPGYVNAMAEKLMAAEKKKYAPQNAQQAPQKQRGKGGFLSSLISEATGMGGAGLGALIGSAAGPLGTLVGAGLGGFIGGTGGRVAENKYRDNRVGLGDALKEGALTGILSPGPIKLAKAAFGASKAAVGGARGVSALTQAAEKQASKSVLAGVPGTKWATNAANRLETRSAGVGVGQKIPGKDALWPDATRDVIKTMQDYGANVGARDTAAGKLQFALKGAKTELGNAIQQGNRKLTSTEVNSLVNTYKQAVRGKYPTKDVLEHAAEYERVIRGSVKTLGDLPGLRTTLYDDVINFGRNSASAVPGRERAAKTLTTTLNKFLDDTSPAIRAADKEVARLRVAGDYAVNAAGKLTNAASNAGASISGKLMTGDTAQNLKGRVGSAVVNRNPRVSPIGAGLKAGLAGAITPEPPLPPEEQPAQDLNSVLSQYSEEGVEGGISGLGSEEEELSFAPSLDQQQTQQETAYTLEQALSDARRDPKNSEKYLSFAKAFGDQEEARAKASGAGGLNVTKVTSQQYGLAERGYKSLQQLDKLLQGDPGVLNRARVPGRSVGLFGIGADISRTAKTGDFDAIGYNIASSLLRLETGAAANKEEILKLQSQIMPRAGDPPETVKTKLGQLEQAFKSVLSRAQSSGGSGIADALEQLQSQGGYQ